MQPCRIFRTPMNLENRRRARAAEISRPDSEVRHVVMPRSGGASPRSSGAAQGGRLPAALPGGGGKSKAARGNGGGNGRNGPRQPAHSRRGDRLDLEEMAERDRELYSKPAAPTFQNTGSSGSRPSSSRRKKAQAAKSPRAGASSDDGGSSPRETEVAEASLAAMLQHMSQEQVSSHAIWLFLAIDGRMLTDYL